MTMIFVLAALLPPLFLLRYIYRLDRVEPEPPRLLVLLFVLGMLSVLPAMLLEIAFSAVLESVHLSPVLVLILDNFVVVALAEEGCKFFFLKMRTWKHEAFNYRFDGIVYAAVVSLGFAAAENVLYVFEYGLSIALVRALTSIPGHAIFGIYMGYFYGVAKHAQLTQEDPAFHRRFLRFALLVPILLHGFYDMMLSTENDYMILVFIVYLIILNVAAWRFLKRNAREDRPVDLE